MRVFFCLFVFSATINDVFSQQEVVKTQILPEEKLYFCFANETDACTDYRQWYQYIDQHTQPGQLPVDSLTPGKYTINFQIIIDKEGMVNVRTVMNDPGFGIGEKLKEVLEQYPHQWQPAEQNGRRVKYYFKQPVALIIEEKKSCNESTAALML